MNTNYSKIDEQYGSLKDYLNDLYYSDSEGSLQEFLFELGLAYCVDKPKFYTECECFWNYYVRIFYDKMDYILISPEVQSDKRLEKADHLFRTYNTTLQLSDELRQEIFIEYQTKIDERLKPKNKKVQTAVKTKRSHLKEI